MEKKRRKFSREFKLEAIRLLTEKGYSQAQVSRDLDLRPDMLRRWKKEFSEDPTQSFPGHGNLKDGEKELEELRRENARLRTENAFLKKVSGYFARGQQ